MGFRIRRDTEKSGPGRSELGPRRPDVVVGGEQWWFDDDDGPTGSAGMREPRRPLPPGPLSAAGERPIPEPPMYLKLADARH